MPIPEKYVVRDLVSALDTHALPTVTTWNRLEGRPRRDDFDRALKAEVRDAWWMLARQWQSGEFQADDAGSPIFAKMRTRTSPVTRYQAKAGPSENFAAETPMEAKVEQRLIRWRLDGHKMHFDLRAQLGRHWRHLLGAAGLIAYEPKYLDKYSIELPARDATTDYVYAHRRGWQQLAALAGRSIDGGDLLEHLATNPAHRASDGIVTTSPGDPAKLDGLGVELQQWFARLYMQPEHEAAWKPEYLEYQFACSVPQAGHEVVLAADEYARGHLDWYSFDRAALPAGLGGAAATMDQVTVTPFIPTLVGFEGMPDRRWWALEDRKTDFGAVKPSTTDLARLLLMEFGLVYGNDWFSVPLRIPAGTLALVEGLVVTNNFGERFWITAAGAGATDNWHRWGMFEISAQGTGARAADTSLFVPPAAARTLDGDPFDAVELGRDEVANLVWAVECTIPSPTGVGRAGRDEARETLQYHRQLVAATNPPPPEYAAPISYLAMTTVPEHWIPFVPVHVPGSVREIQLVRGRMLRILEGGPTPPPKVAPRTTLIRQGLDQTPAQGYFVHEEEVPRAGALVTQMFRRTRWTGGEAPVWVGIRKQTGRGERGSGLAFDSIVDAKPPA